MKQFSLKYLTDNRVYVHGTNDAGMQHETILDGTVLREIQQHYLVHKAGNAYDRTVEQFFAPLTDAAGMLQMVQQPLKEDPAFVYVVEEGVEPIKGVEPEAYKLDHDGAVLRLLEAGDIDRLIWVTLGNTSSIEILEYQPPLDEGMDPIFGGDRAEAGNAGISLQEAEAMAEAEAEYYEGLAREAEAENYEGLAREAEAEYYEGLAREAFEPDDVD